MPLVRRRQTGPANRRGDLQEYSTTASDAETQFKIAGSDKGGDPFRKLCRLMPSVNKSQVFYRAGSGCCLLHQILRMSVRKQAVQPEVAQQADNKHSVAQYRRHPLGIKAAGSISISDKQHDPAAKPSEKPASRLGFCFGRERQETRANKGGGARQWVRISGTDIHYSLSICRPNSGPSK